MYTSIQEIEFFHLMRRREAPDNDLLFWPTPEEALYPTANTPVKELTANGVLILKNDGAIEHGSWNQVKGVFTKFGLDIEIPSNGIRAWGPLPF